MGSLRIPSAGPGNNLFKDGYNMHSGIEEAVIRNIHAVVELAEIVRTSFGPNGRNKMVINHLERLFVTSDAATIIRELEVVHPAGKVLVMASQQQEVEMGDRTNLVLILAGELLRKAEYLLTMGLHPSEVVLGYEMARDRAIEELEKLSIRTLETPLTDASLRLALKPTLASKQYGSEDLLSKLVAEAVMAVMPKNPKNFNVDNVRVVKILGGGLSQSRVVRGMVFGREPEGTVLNAANAKVGVFTCGIDIAQTETKGTVLLKNSEELLNFSRGEEKHMEKIFQELADSGLNVVVAGSSVGELALHYLNRHGILVIKVLSKFDLRRLCRVVGATPLARLGAPTIDEMGQCDIVETVEIGGDRVTVFRQADEATRTATVVVRGATTNQMDDIERAIDDGVNVVKGILKDARLVAGAGATELELAKRIAEIGEKTPGLAQHAIKRFADALEVVPRTLAENAGLDATETLSRLYAAHQADERGVIGVDIEGENGGLIDAEKHEIFDLLAATRWALRYGTDAAVSVLRVDSIIMSRQAGGPAAPKQNPNWDED
ncbi:T-complex protein 1 subunit theta [Microbotryum lychnidis-dioicae p1A1 Lamole]|uniref:CCT-theta n=2 Tax=Microbotryum TaxID=34416 RepID=U5GXS6_USTV1|nr:T-complex protein 1 subunit theta [Microbotryum lychnidis-dioicae p1A1 Lamole]SGZ30635.1 BQ5605_C049g12420 [Microbotryum silenes-dioicae]|eukprot:KDE09595.1 T-complex protein 1 subunit theta [Microbotryum lychnidis-dioicae p1A1 Lamole]